MINGIARSAGSTNRVPEQSDHIFPDNSGQFYLRPAKEVSDTP
jgi:hypothetical protein